MRTRKNKHYSIKYIIACLVIIIAIFNGCSLSGKRSSGLLEREIEVKKPTEISATQNINIPLELGLSKRMVIAENSTTDVEEEKRYNFKAKEMDINMALELFAKINNLNIITSHEIEGNISVEFKNLTFDNAMKAILEPYGYYWKIEDTLIHVAKYETKIFTIDYIRLIREGKGSSLASVASSGGGTGAATGNVAISTSDKLQFWVDLEKQLKGMLTEEASLTINQMSGSIYISDIHKNVKMVEEFINSIIGSVLRQVEIEAKILEVSLAEDFSLGIDWGQVIKSISDGANIDVTNIVRAPFGPSSQGDPNISLEYGLLGGDFNAVLQALSNQGELKVISKPKIRVMNNQPALIKVGTDRPFFETTKTLGEGTKNDTITEQIRFITEGLVLSITPQISKDGWIMLDIIPIITRLVQTVESQSGSTAPMMDVKQSSTVVRMKDGEMITVGGLIQDVKAETVRKVPLLGDIPFLGNLFKGTFKTNNNTELVIFITPRIISKY